MKLEIRQIDAWKDPDNCWVYNDSIPVREVEYEGELNRSKVLKLLRQLEILSPRKLYKVDDYLFYQGTWIVRMKNDRPVYEVQELDNL